MHLIHFIFFYCSKKRPFGMQKTSSNEAKTDKNIVFLNIRCESIRIFLLTENVIFQVGKKNKIYCVNWWECLKKIFIFCIKYYQTENLHIIRVRRERIRSFLLTKRVFCETKKKPHLDKTSSLHSETIKHSTNNVYLNNVYIIYLKNEKKL